MVNRERSIASLGNHAAFTTGRQMRSCRISARWALAMTIALIFFSAPGIAQVALLEGRIIAVSDGDTVTILSAAKVQTKVRLVGIDAPERKQAFGTRSKEALAALVFNRHVTIKYKKKDRYGRVLGKILVSGVDANLEQVRAGMAWHYKQYQRDQEAPDRLLYAQAEREARLAKRGLWSDQHAVAPWDFRRNPKAYLFGMNPFPDGTLARVPASAGTGPRPSEAHMR